MSAQQNVQVLQKAYADFKKGDIKSVVAAMTADADWFVPGPSDVIPFVGHRRGQGQISDFFAKLAENQDVELMEPRQFVAQGDRVVVLGEYRWRVKPTGHSFSSDFAHAFTLKDGKVTSFHEYYDTSAAVEAYHAHAGVAH